MGRVETHITDEVKVTDSSGTVIDPATEGTLASVLAELLGSGSTGLKVRVADVEDGVAIEPPTGPNLVSQFTLTPTPQTILAADLDNYQYAEVRNHGDLHYFIKAVSSESPNDVSESNSMEVFIAGSSLWALLPGESLQAICENVGSASSVVSVRSISLIPIQGETYGDGVYGEGTYG